MPSLNVIGAGKLGRVFARLWALCGVLQVQQILNRDVKSAYDAIAMIGAGSAAQNLTSMRAADLWMLSVPDDALMGCCQALAAARVLRPGDIVFHCSGAKSSADLQLLASQGAYLASIHPVRSFADPLQVAADFAGTICSVEGDEAALRVLQPILQAIGAKVVQIEAAQKLLYHAGSVFASNYLVSLMDVALQAYQAAGIPTALAQAMAEPLARQTLENVWQLGTQRALTGPLARGDLDTVRKQSAIVHQWDQQAGQLYDSFIASTQNLIARRESES